MSLQAYDTPTLAQNLERRSKISPDFCDLRFKREIVLFVYDNLQTGAMENTKLLQGSKYLGEAETLSSFYVMKEAIDFPIVFKEKVLPHASIRGEAYLVGPQHILTIDEYLDNMSLRERITDRIILKDQKKAPWRGKSNAILGDNSYVEGFLYVGFPEAWKTQKLTTRPTRHKKFVTHPAVEARPFYQWDTWEAEWPNATRKYNYANTYD